MKNKSQQYTRPEEVKPPIIIGGAPRSGTTLLRTMLDSHPNIGCGLETNLTFDVSRQVERAWKEVEEWIYSNYNIDKELFIYLYGHYLEAILEAMRRDLGKNRVADKRPQNIEEFSITARMLPESPLIHIIRDGRSVVCSLLEKNWRYKYDGKLMEITQYADQATFYWNWIVRKGRAMRNDEYSHLYYELFYEDLVCYPEETMKNLLDFLGEPWSEKVLEHHKDDHRLEVDTNSGAPLFEESITKWERKLTAEQKEVIYEYAGDLLQELGYVK